MAKVNPEDSPKVDRARHHLIRQTREVAFGILRFVVFVEGLSGSLAAAAAECHAVRSFGARRAQ